MRNAKDPPRCAALARAGLGYLLPRLFEEALGVKLNMVLGYGGGGEMNLAIEKGEVHCRAGTVSAYVGREPTRTWIKNGVVRAITQSGTKRYPKLPDVPTLYELMDAHKTPDATKRVARGIAFIRRSRPALYRATGDAGGPGQSFARRF